MRKHLAFVAVLATLCVALWHVPLPAQVGDQPIRISPSDPQFTQLLVLHRQLLDRLNRLSLRGSQGELLRTQNGLLLTQSMNAVDPCYTNRKGNVAISQVASTKLVSGQPGQLIWVCYARVVAGAAEIPSFMEGTGAACATSPVAVSGSTTGANGESYAANGGFSGGVGIGTIAVTKVFGNDLCLAQSGSNRLAGNITYVFNP